MGNLIFLSQESPSSAIGRFGAVSASQEGFLKDLNGMIYLSDVKLKIITRSF